MHFIFQTIYFNKFILQCQKVQNNHQLVLKIAQTIIGPIFTFNISYHSLYMNQLPGDGYFYTRLIKQTFIPLFLNLYSTVNVMTAG